MTTAVHSRRRAQNPAATALHLSAQAEEARPDPLPECLDAHLQALRISGLGILARHEGDPVRRVIGCCVDRLGDLLDSDDGLLVQSVDDQAVLTNTTLRWFRQRRADEALAKPNNVVAFPVPKPVETDEPELPFAEAC